jgi:hypothetical protein
MSNPRGRPDRRLYRAPARFEGSSVEGRKCAGAVSAPSLFDFKSNHSTKENRGSAASATHIAAHFEACTHHASRITHHPSLQPTRYAQRVMLDGLHVSQRLNIRGRKPKPLENFRAVLAKAWRWLVHAWGICAEQKSGIYDIHILSLGQAGDVQS